MVWLEEEEWHHNPQIYHLVGTAHRTEREMRVGLCQCLGKVNRSEKGEAGRQSDPRGCQPQV